MWCRRSQRVLGIPGARLVAVDVLCETAGGDLVAVEVQKRKEEDPPRRMRYVRACSEAWAVRRGTEFAEVPRVATVYISRADPFGDGLPLYHVDRVVRETGRRVDDGAVDVYANVASARGGSALERLLRYMARSEGELEGFPALSARVQYFKETPKGRAEMNELIEEYAREMADEAKAEGKAEGGAEMLLASLKNLMANLGLAADAAMDALGVPEGERAGYRAKLV